MKRLLVIAVNAYYFKTTWYAQSNVIHFALLIGVQCVFDVVLLSVMQTAWRERNPVARIKAAHDALEKNPDCAPAYILLAEEEATTILDVEKMLKQALRAAEMNYKKSQQLQHQGSLMEALHSKLMVTVHHRVTTVNISHTFFLTSLSYSPMYPASLCMTCTIVFGSILSGNGGEESKKFILHIPFRMAVFIRKVLLIKKYSTIQDHYFI